MIILCKKYLSSEFLMHHLHALSLCNSALYKYIKFNRFQRTNICLQWNFSKFYAKSSNLEYYFEISKYDTISDDTAKNVGIMIYGNDRIYNVVIGIDIITGNIKNNMPYGRWIYKFRDDVNSLMFNYNGRFICEVPELHDVTYNIINNHQVNVIINRTYEQHMDHVIHCEIQCERGKNFIISCMCPNCSKALSCVKLELDVENHTIIFTKGDCKLSVTDITNVNMEPYNILYNCLRLWETMEIFVYHSTNEEKDVERINDVFNRMHAPSRP